MLLVPPGRVRLVLLVLLVLPRLQPAPVLVLRLTRLVLVPRPVRLSLLLPLLQVARLVLVLLLQRPQLVLVPRLMRRLLLLLLLWRVRLGLLVLLALWWLLLMVLPLRLLPPRRRVPHPLPGPQGPPGCQVRRAPWGQRKTGR